MKYRKYFPSGFLTACYRSRFDNKQIQGHLASWRTPWSSIETEEQLTTPNGGMLSECQFPRHKPWFWIHPAKRAGEDLKTPSLGLVSCSGDCAVFQGTSSLIPMILQASLGLVPDPYSLQLICRPGGFLGNM